MRDERHVEQMEDQDMPVQRNLKRKEERNTPKRDMDVVVVRSSVSELLQLRIGGWTQLRYDFPAVSQPGVWLRRFASRLVCSRSTAKLPSCSWRTAWSTRLSTRHSTQLRSAGLMALLSGLP